MNSTPNGEFRKNSKKISVAQVHDSKNTYQKLLYSQKIFIFFHVGIESVYHIVVAAFATSKNNNTKEHRFGEKILPKWCSFFFIISNRMKGAKLYRNICDTISTP